MIQFDRDWYQAQGMTFPLWRTDKKYSRSQTIQDCKKCGDTSFELLIDGKPQGKCCRCGEKFQ